MRRWKDETQRPHFDHLNRTNPPFLSHGARTRTCHPSPSPSPFHALSRHVAEIEAERQLIASNRLHAREQKRRLEFERHEAELERDACWMKDRRALLAQEVELAQLRHDQLDGHRRSHERHDLHMFCRNWVEHRLLALMWKRLAYTELKTSFVRSEREEDSTPDPRIWNDCVTATSGYSSGVNTAMNGSRDEENFLFSGTSFAHLMGQHFTAAHTLIDSPTLQFDHHKAHQALVQLSEQSENEESYVDQKAVDLWLSGIGDISPDKAVESAIPAASTLAELLDMLFGVSIGSLMALKPGILPSLPVQLVLLGPPFSGKHTQAHRIATALNLSIIDMSPTDTNSKWTHDKQMQHVFSEIRGVARTEANGWILIDFPQTSVQAEQLERALSGFEFPFAPEQGLPVLTKNREELRDSRVAPLLDPVISPTTFFSSFDRVIVLHCPLSICANRACGLYLCDGKEFHILRSPPNDLELGKETLMKSNRRFKDKLLIADLYYQWSRKQFQITQDFWSRFGCVSNIDATRNEEQVCKDIVTLCSSIKADGVTNRPLNSVVMSSRRSRQLQFPSLLDVESACSLSERWIRFEKRYMMTLKKLFQVQRELRRAALAVQTLISCHHRRILCQENEKVQKVRRVVELLRSSDPDDRLDEHYKDEMHLQVDELHISLNTLLQQQMSDCEQFLKCCETDGFSECLVRLIAECYLRLLCSENARHRCVSSLCADTKQLIQGYSFQPKYEEKCSIGATVTEKMRLDMISSVEEKTKGMNKKTTVSPSKLTKGEFARGCASALENAAVSFRKHAQELMQRISASSCDANIFCLTKEANLRAIRMAELVETEGVNEIDLSVQQMATHLDLLWRKQQKHLANAQIEIHRVIVCLRRIIESSS